MTRSDTYENLMRERLDRWGLALDRLDRERYLELHDQTPSLRDLYETAEAGLDDLRIAQGEDREKMWRNLEELSHSIEERLYSVLDRGRERQPPG